MWMGCQRAGSAQQPRHKGGANCGFEDGTVRFINDGIDLRVFHALGTINGGEKYGLDD
jgi:hypothetical protein